MTFTSEILARQSLQSLVEERGQRILRRFREIAILGVSDSKFLEVLQFVCDYWKDNFRPAFSSLCCEVVGGSPEAADCISLMITLTSAGGGIHDDIIDRSSNKHFRVTVLGKYGIDYALLAGDLLIQKGWTLIRELLEKNFKPEKLREIVDAYGQWTLDVCEAEFMEVQCRQNLKTELGHYLDVLTKSMADVCACARMGAIAGGGSKTEIQILAKFGSSLGLMYRLIDDLKDTLNFELNLADRLQQESVPLPILYAAKKSDQGMVILKRILRESAIKNLDIKGLWKICLDSDAFSYTDKIGKQITRESLRDLKNLKPSSARGYLEVMIKGSLFELSNLVRFA